MYDSNHGRRRWFRLACGVAAIALVAAGCGDDDDDGEASSGSEIEGDVFVTGSSTVEPISVRVAELYADVEPGVNVDVQGPGTGDGFAAFCAGEADISDASRAIEEDEVAACEDSGVEFVELKVGYDGLSVLVNPANPIECLSFADLYALVGPESQGFANWQDAQPLATQLGSDTQFPDLPLEITAPGEESGTYDAFLDLAGIEDIALEQGLSEDDAAALRKDYQASPDDNVIIAAMEGAESPLGFVGYAFAEGAGEGVKLLEVDGGSGCVAPSRDTIADGSYPLSRTLYIYVSKTKLAESPALQAYVDYYVSDTGLIEAVTGTGYVELPADQIEATRSTWTTESA